MRNAACWLPRLILVLLGAIGAMSAVRAAPPALPDSVVAMIPLLPSQRAENIATSADRRTLYVVAEAAQPDAGHLPESVLLTFDVSVPQSPRQLGHFELPDPRMRLAAARDTRVFFFDQANGQLRRQLLVVDASNPTRPTVLASGMIEGAGVKVSADGTCIGVSSFAYRVATDGRLEPADCDASASDMPPLDGLRPTDVLIDRRGQEAIIDRDGHFAVEQVASGRSAEVRRIAIPGHWITSVLRFLAAPETLALMTHGEVYVASYRAIRFDPVTLRRADEASVAQYQRARDAGPIFPAQYDELAQGLANAGVETLMSDAGRHMPPPAAAKILNDYGFWLSRGDDPAAAVRALQKVVTIAPKRAVAWLNLADAARTALPKAATWDAKRRLTRIAFDADAEHLRLTGSQSDAAAEFAAFNMLNAPQDNVCAYVAAFYSHGRIAEVSGIPDPVDIAGEGRLAHVRVEIVGSLQIAKVVATLVDPTPRPGAAPRFPAEFGLSCSECNDATDIRLLPFRDAFYAVPELYGAPEEVRSALGKSVCKITSRDTFALAVNHAPALCSAMLSGQRLPSLPAQELPDGGFDADVLHSPDDPYVEIDGAHFVRAATADLSGTGRSETIGYFTHQDWRGRGCEINRIALLDGKTVQLSTRNAELLDLQYQWGGCQSTTSALVRDGDRILAEIRSTSWPMATALLAFGPDHVEPLCRVARTPIYEAHPGAP